jgi:hypothetical protein
MLGYVEELLDLKKEDTEYKNMVGIQEGYLKLRRKLEKAV